MSWTTKSQTFMKNSRLPTVFLVSLYPLSLLSFFLSFFVFSLFLCSDFCYCSDRTSLFRLAQPHTHTPPLLQSPRSWDYRHETPHLGLLPVCWLQFTAQIAYRFWPVCYIHVAWKNSEAPSQTLSIHGQMDRQESREPCVPGAPFWRPKVSLCPASYLLFLQGPSRLSRTFLSKANGDNALAELWSRGVVQQVELQV